MTKFLEKYRYAICCVFSAAASLLCFVNPLLAGIFVNRAISAFEPPSITPLIAGMAIVNGTRILLRSTVAFFVKGRQRAPLIWLQARIGKWLWWLEPVLHVWGLPGIVMKKFGRWLSAHRLTSRLLHLGPRRPHKNRRLALNVASSITYIITDFFVTALSGVIFYFTRSYMLSLLSVLLPAAATVPWFAKKSKRLHRLRRKQRELSHKGNL
jgi:ABC-type multidrug transport system fused ATPase/permease subunit